MTSTAEPVTDETPAGRAQPAELAGLLRTLWPALVRATRVSEQLPTLPESHLVVLRRLIATGGSTPAQLALDLHLARPTISNLVRDLTASELVERRPSATDGRSVVLLATPRAQRILAAFSRGQVEVVERALRELPAVERDRLVAALPSLHELLVGLSAVEEDPLPAPAA